MDDKFGMACELLKDITVVKEEKEGEVTKSFLRKVYELLEEAEGKEEYIISVGYMVARRKSKNTVEFFIRLRGTVEKLQGDWSKIREELKSLLEHAIKIYYIKAEIGEDLCMKR